MEINEILAHLHIDALNNMQQQMWKECPQHNNVVLLSPTGTGKTLAYLLPLVASLKADVDAVQAVVLVPSRELALQTEQVFKSMGTPFKAVSCYGGRPAMEEHRTLNAVRPQVVIGTPGRMNDHLGKENFGVDYVTTLVIDEFDKSLEFGFHDEMQSVISQLPQLRKRVLLSATEAEEIPQFVGLGGRTCVVNYLKEKDNERIETFIVHSPEKDKLLTLYRLLCQQGDKSTLVFVNYREAVERVGKYLQTSGVSCEMFHGGMEQQDRERALYKFSNGSCNVFVSTDLAARGIDISNVDNIVHYHLPANEDAFIHRNGRTARWEAEGQSFLIVGPEEHVPDYFPKDATSYEMPDDTPLPVRPQWTTLYIGKGKKDKINKVDIVGFLSKKGGLNRDELGRVDVKDHYCFAAVKANKVKTLLRQISGEKIKGVKTIIEIAK